MGSELAQVAHLHLHFVFNFKRERCLWDLADYCGVEGLEIDRPASDGPMTIAGTIIVVQMEVEKAVTHSPHPFKHAQFGKHVLMADIQAQAQKRIVDCVNKPDE